MEWKEDKLGRVLKPKYGKDHKSLTDGIYPCYGSGGLMRHVERKLADGPSILIPRKGTLNNIMYVEQPFWTVDTMFWSEIDQSIIDPKFLYYSICKKDFASMNVGSAVPSMTVPVLNDIDILYPKEIEDQRRIASILSSLDSKIETNNKINAKLEEMAQALFKSWFVDFEPFKDGKFVESELGMIPEGWRVGKLSEIANVTMGQSPKGSSFNEEGIGTVFYQGRTEFGFRFPSVRLFTTEPTRMAEPLSTLMSVRAPVGDLNIATQTCCIGRGIASVKSKAGLDSYVYYLMQSLKPYFDMYNGEGTVFGSINKDALNNMSVLVPSTDVMRLFNEKVKAVDDDILVRFKENLRLSQLRDTLLPKLMNGEIEI